MSEDRARAVAVIAAVDAVWTQDRMIDRMDRREIDDLAERIAALASEREAIGRAAGREEAIKLLERKAREHGRYITQARKLELGEEVCARDRAAQYSLREVRDRLRALPVDGGKDRP